MEKNPPIRLDALLRDATRRLAGTEGRHEAEQLLAHVMGRDRAWLFAHATDLATEAQQVRFEELLSRRVAGEPIAYLIGQRAFWTLDLAVTADTLIPRPETELLVELAIARLPVSSASRVADLGTGSGAIALAIARERPQASVAGTDLSAAALEVARGNATANAIANVEFRHGSWFAPLAGERYQLIASNPPYIAEGDAHLQQGDLRFEPPGALSSGSDGLDAIREIVAGAPGHLLAEGWLLLEHGWEQGEAIRALLTHAGFVDVATARDLEGRDRVSLGRWPG